ncbi:MAG: NAD(P)H-dependent oxidoreductase, partial [Mycobacterium sp.]|nr:NAD(P)H-dependent oxidoreductase [Mycobacterium sp.]
MTSEWRVDVTENANATVLVLVGSLRAASVNRQLAELAAESAPAGVQVTVFDRLGEVPFYNED